MDSCLSHGSDMIRYDRWDGEGARSMGSTIKGKSGKLFFIFKRIYLVNFFIRKSSLSTKKELLAVFLAVVYHRHQFSISIIF